MVLYQKKRDTEKGEILILMDLDSFSPNTIKRGAKLARAFGISFNLLFLIAPLDEEKDVELNFALLESEKISLQHGAKKCLFEKYRSNMEALSKMKKLRENIPFTQVILAHPGESRWEEIIYGSIFNHLIKKMPDLELHFFSINKTFPYEDRKYCQGIHAFLQTGIDEAEYLVYENINSNITKGIFFKEESTDFDTGIFVASGKKGIITYKIQDGKAVACLLNN
jgi:two-component system, OmpR family, sensor histidine kinase KdpD